LGELHIVIRPNWNTDADGTIFTLCFAEEDSKGINFDLKQSTNFENKLDANNTIKTGLDASTKISVEDDVVGHIMIYWWEPKNYEYWLGNEFAFVLE